MSAAASYEQAIQNEIRLELGNGDCSLFGTTPAAFGTTVGGWSALAWPREAATLLVGSRLRIVTFDMVGQTLAVFVALEIKDKGRRPRNRRNSSVSSKLRAGLRE